MMRTFSFIALFLSMVMVIIAGFALQRCALSTAEEEPKRPGINVVKYDYPSIWNSEAVTLYQVPLPDGRKVNCIRASGGGISCDWEGSR